MARAASPKAKTPNGVRRLIPDELRGLRLELAKGKTADAPLFTKENGQRATRHWANYHVKRICKAARVPVLSPQALRRTVSDLATDAGMAGPLIAAQIWKQVRVPPVSDS